VSPEAKRPRRLAAKAAPEASDTATPAKPARSAATASRKRAKPAAEGTAASQAAEAPQAEAAPNAGAEPKAGNEPKVGNEPKAGPAPKGPAPKARAASKPKAAPKAAAAAYQQPTHVGLRKRYHDEVIPALRREFGYANPMQIPRVDKVVVNIGLGEAILNAKAIDAAVRDLATITGQKAIVTRAKRSIAQFRLRTGMPIGAKVTLRGQRMYDFLERTVNLALPRIRDFRGIPTRSFDGRGNFSLGLREQLVFPEIDYDSIDRIRGLEVSIITTARTDEEGRMLLQLLGMPFQSA
jgi:large subunit ribosomal protein L5